VWLREMLVTSSRGLKAHGMTIMPVRARNLITPAFAHDENVASSYGTSKTGAMIRFGGA
jgi:hypothetical protein